MRNGLVRQFLGVVILLLEANGLRYVLQSKDKLMDVSKGDFGVCPQVRNL